jgi:hypothetical protein
LEARSWKLEAGSWKLEAERMPHMTTNDNGSVSRRTFVQTTAAATAAMMFPGAAPVAG